MTNIDPIFSGILQAHGAPSPVDAKHHLADCATAFWRCHEYEIVHWLCGDCEQFGPEIGALQTAWRQYRDAWLKKHNGGAAATCGVTPAYGSTPTASARAADNTPAGQSLDAIQHQGDIGVFVVENGKVTQ